MNLVIGNWDIRNTYGINNDKNKQHKLISINRLSQITIATYFQLIMFKNKTKQFIKHVALDQFFRFSFELC